MTALLLYGYSVGVFSSRKTERACFEDVAFRVLAAGEQPHFTTINEFRATHRASSAALFQQVLKLCMSAGLVKLGHVAIDGTKMKADASKHKAMSYERMVKEEAQLKSGSRTIIVGRYAELCRRSNRCPTATWRDRDRGASVQSSARSVAAASSVGTP